jgi:hypothetical protein
LAMMNETIRLNKIADKMDHLDVEWFKIKKVP